MTATGGLPLDAMTMLMHLLLAAHVQAPADLPAASTVSQDAWLQLEHAAVGKSPGQMTAAAHLLNDRLEAHQTLPVLAADQMSFDFDW